MVFDSPLYLIQTNCISEIPACFAQMEAASKKGCYLAGFLAYEAGYAFEKVLTQKENYAFPLLCFGVYAEARKDRFNLSGGPKVRINGALNLASQEYYERINRIREYIAAGDTYQITFCVKQKFNYAGDPYRLYQNLLNFQPVPYPAYIAHKDFSLLSLSPEMFIDKRGQCIKVKPMKGTMFRTFLGGLRLKYDGKNRAENVMITDLLRNDLGRICSYGTVKTTRLFEVARYRTIYQMTSSVEGVIEKDIPFVNIFKALFPSGSVTGAPKIRSMQIIRELENEERRIYTGAIGYITPRRDLFFNVPIRTILLAEGKGEMGVGGGITYYSTPEGEYEECLIKSRFLM